MRTFFSTLLLFLVISSARSQTSFEGAWSGTLRIQAIELDLIFNIKKEDTAYSATMDSPDQGANGIPVRSIVTGTDSIRMEIPEIGMVYRGRMTGGDRIEGSFEQRGQSFELDLGKGRSGDRPKNRPQEPLAPFPYKSEEITFENKAGKVSLAGTLTIPQGKGPFPAIVLVSGSGPQDRDETLFGHKPFLVLADHLTRNGYAVLRYDDRGTAGSGGDLQKATTADLAQDALAGLQWLKSRKEVQKKKIGIIGHSEGGSIAAMLAAQQQDVGFIVMLAGTGVSGDRVLLQQQELIGKGAQMPDSVLRNTLATNRQIFDIMRSTKDTAQIRERVTLYLNHAYKDGLLPQLEGQTRDAVVNAYCEELLTPWLIHFVQYDPGPDLQKIKIPVLALIGSKDHQVLPQYNIPALRTALAKNDHPATKVMELDGLNHLFQEAGTGMPQEYGSIEQTFAPVAMQTILDWLNGTLKK